MEEEKKLEQSSQKPEQIKNTPSGRTGKGLCVALCIVFLALGFLLSSLYYEHRYKDLSPLAEAMDVVRKNFYYYDEQTESDAITGALKGLAAYLEDNYAEYYTPEEYEELLTSNSGNYIGLGVNAVEERSRAAVHIRSCPGYVCRRSRTAGRGQVYFRQWA